MSTSHGLPTQTGLQLRPMLPSPSSRGTWDPSHRSWERGPTSPSSGPASSTPPPSPTPTSRKTWSALNPFSATQPDLWPTIPTGDTTLTLTRVTALLEKLGWEDLASRRKDARCTLLHKVLNGHVDVDDELRPPYSDTRLRSGASNELKRIPSSMKKCEPYHHSFPRTVRDWNRLPTPARMTKDLEEFKAALH